MATRNPGRQPHSALTPQADYAQQRQHAAAIIGRLRWIERGVFAIVLPCCFALAALLPTRPEVAAPWVVPLLLILTVGLLTHCIRLAAERRYDAGGVR